MSLLKMACDTYDYAKEKYAGTYFEGQKEPLAPIAHSITNASIEITIDKNGKFVSAVEVEKDEAKTIIPVTEKSMGRTSSPEPHPLCDQLQYIGCNDSEKNKLYLKQLNKWNSSEYSHPFLDAVYNYVKKGTVYDDIKTSDIKKFEEKTFVRWRVIGIDEEEESCWKNKKLQGQFTNYYIYGKEENTDNICMVTGDTGKIAVQHAKGIVVFNANAKLISANDSVNFTYRGRFFDDREALTIGYEASQKSHNVLKWLLSNQGKIYDGRAFLCWTPEGKKVPNPISCMMPFGMDESTRIQSYIPSDYKKQLNNILTGWKTVLDESENIVTAVFDAATSGRLALTYYSELSSNDFLTRMYNWDNHCCSINYVYGIESPSIYDIVKYSSGTYREKDFEVDDKIARQMILRLLFSKLESSSFPEDIFKNIVKNAEKLQLYDTKIRNKVLFIACAVIKKYRFDHKKEEWSVALDVDKRDRSYQYGRLLAVLEKEERDAHGSEANEVETNAIRMQSVFVNRPEYAARILIEQIKRAYFKRLTVGSQVYYEKLIGEIYEKLAEYSDIELNKPLEDSYLMGYYMQKNNFYAKSNEKEEEEN